MKTKNLEIMSLQDIRLCHADYNYFKKYGIRDLGGGRQSARETQSSCKVLK